jgi:hypothetical protein
LQSRIIIIIILIPIILSIIIFHQFYNDDNIRTNDNDEHLEHEHSTIEDNDFILSTRSNFIRTFLPISDEIINKTNEMELTRDGPRLLKYIFDPEEVYFCIYLFLVDCFCRCKTIKVYILYNNYLTN